MTSYWRDVRRRVMCTVLLDDWWLFLYPSREPTLLCISLLTSAYSHNRCLYSLNIGRRETKIVFLIVITCLRTKRLRCTCEFAMCGGEDIIGYIYIYNIVGTIGAADDREKREGVGGFVFRFLASTDVQRTELSEYSGHNFSDRECPRLGHYRGIIIRARKSQRHFSFFGTL